MSANNEALSGTGAYAGLDRIKKLYGSEGWAEWNRDIHIHLQINGFLDLLDEAKNEPTKLADERDFEHRKEKNLWKEKQQRALGILKRTINDNAINELDEAAVKKLDVALDKLKTLYQPKGNANFQQYHNAFFSITRSQCSNINEYGEKLRRAHSELVALDSELQISEHFLVYQFLQGLGPDFATFRTSFNQNNTILPKRDADKNITAAGVTLKTAMDAAEQEEIERNHTTLTALIAQTTGPITPCTVCGKYFHDASTCFKAHPELRKSHNDKKRKQREEKKERREKKPRPEEGKKGKEEEGGNTMAFAHHDDNPGAGFLAVSDSRVEEIDDPDAPVCLFIASEQSSLSCSYILDTGASLHASCRRQDFVGELKPFKGTGINGIGYAKIQPLGVGTVRIRCKHKGRMVWLQLSNVLFCPNLGTNLISVSKLIQAGANINFMRERATVSDGRTTFSATEVNGLWALDLWRQEGPPLALAAYSIENPRWRLWHNRFGHLGEQNLEKTAKCVVGMRPLPYKCLCKPCVQGRMKGGAHVKPAKPGTAPLEFIHTDIAGPMPVTGIGGKRYWVTFLDDYTQTAEAIPITEKSELFVQFRSYLRRHETPERRCRRLRLDRAGENKSQLLEDFCRDQGIVIEPTGREQHQQNGAAEVLNRIFQEKLTPTLIKSELDLKWWPEVLLAMAVVRNVSYNTKIEKTPYEAWHGQEPDVTWLRTIGSKGSVIKTERQRDKIHVRTEECTLLGFQGSKIYRLLNKNGNMIYATDVVFDEDVPHVPELADDVVDAEASTSAEAPVQPSSPATNEPPSRTGTKRPASVPAGEFPKRAKISVADPVPIAVGGEQADPIAFKVPWAQYLPDQTAPQQTPRPDESPPRPDLPPPQPDELRESPEMLPIDKAHVNEPNNNGATRISQRSNKGTDTRIKYGLLFALLGAAMHDAEPFEPKNLRQAKHDRYWPKWFEGMKDEHGSLVNNKTWTLVARPKDRRVLGGKWVYKLKRGPDGEILRWKARWVVRGFEQEEGLDYNETFASVVKPMSYKAMFAIAAALDLEVHQMDVKTAFLYGDVDEEIYVEQPTGLEDGTNRVCRLNKALYGLKQSPRIWYNTLSAYLDSLGFKPLTSDMGVFVKGHVYIAVFVDDLLIMGPSTKEIQHIKDSLEKRFEMTDLGPCAYYLGMSVRRDRQNRAIFLSQRAYIEKVIRDFGMEDAKHVCTPMSGKLEPPPDDYTCTPQDKTWYASAVGSLMYAMLGTRPDIAYAISVCSRYLGNPGNAQITAVKRIIRYLKGTLDYELVFRGPLEPLVGYTDSDWGGDSTTRRSTAGYVFNLGSAAVSWKSKRQTVVALSSCEAEYMGQTQATKEAVWLRRLLCELLQEEEQPAATIIYGDNQGAIALASNPERHDQTKHIGIQTHWVREKLADGTIRLVYIPTEQQIADGLTKHLPRDRFEAFRKALGLEKKLS